MTDIRFIVVRDSELRYLCRCETGDGIPVKAGSFRSLAEVAHWMWMCEQFIGMERNKGNDPAKTPPVV